MPALTSQPKIKGIRGGGKKTKGRLIFKAWAQDSPKVYDAILQAINATAIQFNKSTEIKEGRLMANVVVSAIATFNGKALTKGKKQLTDFEKSTQKLGKTFAKVFAGVAITAFGKSAVNAFIESEKAAAKLRTTVKNLGLEV